MAKLALDLERAVTQRQAAGTPAGVVMRTLAEGDGWSVSDGICTSGPDDRKFEEEHTAVSIAVVVAGSFEYRSASGHELLTPGSLMLGNPGQAYECAHEHSTGDRCIAFRFSRDFFDRLGSDARLRALRVPPLKSVSPLVARAAAGLHGAAVVWEELGLQIAAESVRLAGTVTSRDDISPAAIWRVTRAIRRIENEPEGELTLDALSAEAGLSPFHFLRIFERLTGATPHQYVLRARLREAAERLITEPDNILDVALDCGFREASHFTRAFRAEFGVSPKAWRPRRSRSTRGRGRPASR